MNIPQHLDLGVSTDLAALDRTLDVNGLFLVDAGCGNMHLSRAMAERGANVLAIDPDPVQAHKNRQADAIDKVAFVQTGADTIPVDSHCVDGVLFPYSLHHIPADLYPSVFQEMKRILKPQGFLYVMEPVAAGDLNEVIRLFHDEQAVRQAAQDALDSLGAEYFTDVDSITYRIPTQYKSWEEFAARYASKSYNTNYTEEQVRAEVVRDRFMQLGTPKDFAFELPMKVTYLRNIRND